MINKILSVAQIDDRIRAVILNGSRANKKIAPDEYQDFDIVYLVTELESFEANHSWIDIFGERIILQMPNSMKIDEDDRESEKEEVTYLMLFKNFQRIDLTLIEVKNRANCKDSLTKVLLDKDELFDATIESSDEDYWIYKPTQKEFSDCCNEFWWVATYVVKGLARKQPIYAKESLEVPVRKMFMRMLAWYVGTQSGFSINLGQHHRFIQKYLAPEMWERIEKTYPSLSIVEIWASLLEMTRIFHEVALIVSDQLAINYNSIEANNVRDYIHKMEDRISGY